MFRFGDPGGRIYTSVGAGYANLLAHWTSASGGWSVSAGNGRHDGGSSLRQSAVSGFTEARILKTLDAQPTWGLAFGFRAAALPTGSVGFCGLLDAGTIQVQLALNPDGTLSLSRGGTVLATSSSALALNAYYHVELKATINGLAGAYEVRVNGTSAGWVPPATGQNTRVTANNSANVVSLGATTQNNSSNGAWDYDDLIVYDGQATDPNGNADITGPIGDCGLAWLRPTGAGATTQFAPDSGANYARVNEATPDGDTSYVESGTVGNIDTYAMADLPAGATAVKSVATVHYARKTDVGSRGMKAELRSAGGNAAHATEIALGNSYQYYFSNWGRDPNNGTPADWTAAAVNALEAGQTVSS